VTWDVILGGTVVGSSAKSAGWSASYGSATGKLTITAPLSAKLATSYEARVAYKSGTNYSITFSVVMGLKGFHLLPTSVVGGGPTTGTITLTSKAPTGGTKVVLTSGSKNVKVPAAVTISAGAAVGTFTVNSVSVSSNFSTTVSVACNGESLSSTLKVYAKAVVAFKKPAVYPVPGADDGIYAADLDGDGHPDVLVGGANQIGVLYNKGDGTLLPYQSVYTWSGGINVQGAADLTGNGRLDIIATAGGGWVLIFMNQGKRQFADPIALNVPDATFVVVADFNRDGKPDLAVESSPPDVYGGSMQIWLNKGNGKFVEASSFSLGAIPGAIWAGNLKGDSNPDLLVSQITDIVGQSGVSTFYGDGKGNFSAGPGFGTCSFNTGGCLIADLNGDGIPDIVQANWQDGSVSIMYGNGDGTFQNPGTFAVGGVGAGCRVADVDGDGQPDLLVAAGDTAFSVLVNHHGLFPTYLHVETGGHGTRSLDVADFNGDGKPDVVTQGLDSNTISVLLNARP
jgi:hypothetical protein